MKKIRTKIFKLNGIWQLGFQHLNAEDRTVLVELRGLRYNGMMKMWHIAFHSGTLSYLNKKYDGKYYFLADPVARSDAPGIEASELKREATITLDDSNDRMFLKHSFDSTIYSKINKIEGTIYDRDRRSWVLSADQHYSQVIELLRDYGFEVTERRPEIAIKSQGETGAKEAELQTYLTRFNKELYIRNMSRRTIESYIPAMKQFLEYFSGRDIQEITNEEVRDYNYELGSLMGYSYSTMNVHISAIKTFYKCLYNIELRQVDIPRPAKSKSLPKVISREEIERMIAKSRNLKHRTIIMVLYSTAMRREEITNLKLSDIDFEEKKIRIHGKGDKDRYVYLSEILANHLHQYMRTLSTNKYLFEGQNGARYSLSSVGNVVKKAGLQAGIRTPVTPHMLRHSFATHMLSSGVSIGLIQKILGHSNISTTLIYTHITDNDLRNLPNPLDALNI